MPAAIDLAGKTFGKLAVIGAIGYTSAYGGCRVWRCLCECGAQLDVPQKRLPYAEWIVRMPRRAIYACAECAGKTCVVCGEVIPRTRLPAVTCRGECADIHRKKRGRENWKKRVERDPRLIARMTQRRREKAQADPDYAARLAAWEKQKYARHRERMKTDPEYAEAFRKRQNEIYAANAERIQAERRERLDAMTPAEQQEWAARARAYCSRWKRNHLADLKKNPEEYRRVQDLRNEYQRIRHELLSAPPIERKCVICQEPFSSRKFRVLCRKTECKEAYGRDRQAAHRARLAEAKFRQIEVEIMGRIKTTCPDRC